MLYLHRKKTFILKARLLLLFSFFIVSFTSQAQKYITDLNLWDHDNKPYYFGISLGANLARFQLNHNSKFLQDDSVYTIEPVSSGGFSLGLSATARLTDRFQLRFNPQLIFMERDFLYKLKFPGFEGETDVTKKIESVIVTFPIQVKLQSDRINNFRVYMFTGIKGDIDLASNARAKKAEDLVKINKYDYGIELGLGFNFFFKSFILSPEIKISNGIRNIHSRDPNLIYSNVLDRIQSRMIAFCIHIEG
ncbi:MAG: PorT family protein [Bacteroidetes bacterium]|nr:PorT family protein [Bacteroidota bacterium]MBS1634105.1 PorT family protein [Bacteroidota bacterium]